jgi:hypothetical protein
MSISSQLGKVAVFAFSRFRYLNHNVKGKGSRPYRYLYKRTAPKAKIGYMTSGGATEWLYNAQMKTRSPVALLSGLVSDKEVNEAVRHV